MVLVTTTLAPVSLRGQKGDWVVAASPTNSDVIYVAQDPSLLVIPSATNPDPQLGYAPLDSGSYIVLHDFEGTLYVKSNSGTQLLVIMPLKGMNNLQTEFRIMPTWLHGGEALGGVHAAFSTVMAIYNLKELAILVKWTGTPGAGLFYTVEVSVDQVTWITVDSGLAVTNGASAIDAIQYNASHLATTKAVNPANFTYVRFTVPDGGVGQGPALVIWGVKQ